jgi:hypothetical protein
MTTFSTNLKIELIGTGEQSGTWGTTTNNNFQYVFEQAIVGRGNPVFASDANLTLTYTDVSTSQTARNLYLNVTSGVSLTATRDLIVPTVNKTYVVENNTTGAQSIRVITAAGTGITIPNGRKMAVYVDGTNVVSASDYVILSAGTIGGSNIVSETGTQTLTNKTFVAPALGTPASGTLTNTTGFPVANLAGAGSGVLTFLATPSSANLAAAVTGETGSGALVFGTGPSIAGGALSGTFSGTPTFSGNVTFSSTGAITAPVGTTGERPSATVGMLRFNSSATAFEGYNGSAWTSLGGATGGVGNPAFYENDITITADYTISTNKNAGSFGPITVDSGVTVTVPDGSTWTIV